MSSSHKDVPNQFNENIPYNKTPQYYRHFQNQSLQVIHIGVLVFHYHKDETILTLLLLLLFL